MNTYSKELQRRINIKHIHEHDITGEYTIIKIWQFKNLLKFRTKIGKLITAPSEYEFAIYRLSNDMGRKLN